MQNKLPKAFSFSPGDLALITRLAHRLCDGNESLLVRQAVRDYARRYEAGETTGMTVLDWEDGNTPREGTAPDGREVAGEGGRSGAVSLAARAQVNGEGCG